MHEVKRTYSGVIARAKPVAIHSAVDCHAADYAARNDDGKELILTAFLPRLRGSVKENKGCTVAAKKQWSDSDEACCSERRRGKTWFFQAGEKRSSVSVANITREKINKGCTVAAKKQGSEATPLFVVNGIKPGLLRRGGENRSSA